MVKGCPGGSEIVPHNISSHLSKNYATLPPANWVLGGPVALWRLVQRNWGPDWRVRRVWRVCKAKISSPRLAPPLGALGNGTHQQASFKQVFVLLPPRVRVHIGHGSRSVPIKASPFISKYEDILCTKCSHTDATNAFKRRIHSRSGFFSPSYRLSQSAAGLGIHRMLFFYFIFISKPPWKQLDCIREPERSFDSGACPGQHT